MHIGIYFVISITGNDTQFAQENARQDEASTELKGNDQQFSKVSKISPTVYQYKCVYAS